MVKNKRIEKSTSVTKVIEKVIKPLFFGLPTDIIKITKGKVNKVFEVRTPKRNFIIRMNSHHYLDEYEKEKQSMEKVKALGVPTPTIIKLGIEPSYVYMVYESIPGLPADEYPGDKLKVWYQLGKYAALINSIETYGYGGKFQFKPNSRRKTNNYDEWVNYLDKGIEMVLKSGLLVEYGVIQKKDLSNIRNNLEKLKGWRFQPRLCHGNLALKNTIVNRQGEVKAVLDWGDAVSNRAPHFEFATTLFWITLKEQKAFLEGYGLNWETYISIKRDVERLQLLEHLGSAIWYIQRKDYRGLKYAAHKLKPLITS